MKRRFLVALFLIVCALCLAFALSSCGTNNNYTFEMEEGIVYFTDFSIKYTSAEDSPNGDIDESSLTDEISGSVQSYYLVMNFDMQLASNTDGLEYITVEFVVLDAGVVETIVNYADTSNTSAITSDGQTTVTATFSMPDKARSVKNINFVLELKPKAAGTTDIFYSFLSDTKQISGYTDEDITYNYTSSSISTSKTSLEYTLNEDGQSYSVTGIGTKSGVTIYIKKRYNGLPVTSIGSSAFYGYTSLTKITIPDSVTSIGSSTFSGCTSLTKITIPDSVTSIGSYAFSDCSSLTYYEYDDAYYLGTDVNNYVVLVNITNDYIKSFTVNEKTNIIYDEAFYDCSKLTSVTISDSVTSIGRSAFSGCSKLTSITIPNGVTTIGSSVFENCTSLTGITIPDSVTSIGAFAFDGCVALTSITIPDSVTFIGSSTFNGCTSLTSVTIGNGVTYIGRYAFHGCTLLTSATFENTSGWYVTTIEGDTSDILSSDLENTSTAAKYLSNTYYNYYWYRSES